MENPIGGTPISGDPQMEDSMRCPSFEVAKQRLDEMGPISDDEKVFLFVMLGSSTNPSTKHCTRPIGDLV